MKDEEVIISMIRKYGRGECTEEEKRHLEGAYNAISRENAGTPYDEMEDDEGLDSVLQLSKSEEEATGVETTDEFESEAPTEQKTKSLSWPFKILFIAAAVVVIANLWTVLFTNPNSLPSRYSNDVDPGGNKATLTLTNGKKIELSDTKTGVVIDASKLAYNDGTLISTEHSETFTISTPRGGTYQVRLPDGSLVWLNAASSVTYQTSTKNGVAYRIVNLKGEAYFEVSKNKQRPFVVTTDKQTVTVLGTHFNINSYADDATVKTTLLEGSVLVALPSPSEKETVAKSIVLKPGEQSVNRDHTLQIKPADADDLAIAWKNGEFSFLNEPLEEIMKMISRWYDVEVFYKDPNLKKITFGGSISKFKNASSVLHMLEISGNVEFQINGKTITVRHPQK